MSSTTLKILLTFLMAVTILQAQDERVVITGAVVSGKENKPVQSVVVRMSSSPYSAETGRDGRFTMAVPKKPVIRLLCQHTSYESFTKELKTEGRDTLSVIIKLNEKSNLLEPVTVTAVHQPETLVGKPDYGIFDFDFYEDKLILLTSRGSLKEAQIQLSDYSGTIYAKYQLPKEAGEAQNFYHDYEGYTNIVCKDSIFRLDVMNADLLMLTLRRADFEKYLKHIADTAHGNYYYSNAWEKYPSFNYYATRPNDSVSQLLRTISNEDLMKLYNLEYYYLPSRMQLEARRIADEYKTDHHIVAALMSGFTNSMYYEPLYAPLFIINDTICIFNHHNDFLYHYNRDNKLIDSVRISYHHPKSWREWKKKLFVDELQNKVYAFFSRDGHNYLKQIDYQSGKEVLTYKLKHHSAEKIKIKNGYVYYIYRPFGSTQEKFLYRERIE